MHISQITIGRVTLTLLVLALIPAAPLTAAAGADAPESPAQEASSELQEASSEAAEEAQAAPLDAAIAAQHPAYAQRIERLRKLIHDTRAGLLAVRKLPHSTTRWQEHRPRKRERLKTYRVRIRALRASYAEALANAPAASTG
jgi:hypothetical protein